MKGTYVTAKLWRNVAHLIVFFILTSCTARVNEMSIKTNDDLSGHFMLDGSAYLSGKTEEEERKDENYLKAEKIRDSLQGCFDDNSLFYKDHQVFIVINHKFDNSDDLQSRVKCTPSEWKSFKYESKKNSGLFYDEYIINFRIEQDVLKNIAPIGQKPFLIDNQELRYFPAALKIVMPGNIYSFIDKSALLDGTTSSKIVSDSAFQMKLFIEDKRPNREKLLQGTMTAINSGRIPKLNYVDYMEFELHSRKWKFDLTIIISIAGIIFGSGLILELAGRLFRARAVKKDG